MRWFDLHYVYFFTLLHEWKEGNKKYYWSTWRSEMFFYFETSQHLNSRKTSFKEEESFAIEWELIKSSLNRKWWRECKKKEEEWEKIKSLHIHQASLDYSEARRWKKKKNFPSSSFLLFLLNVQHEKTIWCLFFSSRERWWREKKSLIKRKSHCSIIAR